MANMARYNGTVQRITGDAIPNAPVWVYREGEAAIAQLFSNRAGTLPIDNPVLAGADGSFFFHAPGGAYRLEVITPQGLKTLRYVPVGLAAESDVQGLNPRGLWSALTTYDLADMVRHGDDLFASFADGNLNNTPDSTTPGDTAYWMYLGPIAGTTEADILAALGITGVIISEDSPSGGVDGNLWLQV